MRLRLTRAVTEMKWRVYLLAKKLLVEYQMNYLNLQSLRSGPGPTFLHINRA